MDDFLTERDQWEARQALAAGERRLDGRRRPASARACLCGCRGGSEHVRRTRATRGAGALRSTCWMALTRNDKARATSSRTSCKQDYSRARPMSIRRSSRWRACMSKAWRARGGHAAPAATSWRIPKTSSCGLFARERLARVQLAQDKADDALKTLGAAEPAAFARALPRKSAAMRCCRKATPPGALAAYRQALAAWNLASPIQVCCSSRLPTWLPSEPGAGEPRRRHLRNLTQ